MLKDLGLAQDAAARTKSSTPLGAMARQIYETSCSSGGNGGKDFGSVFQYIKELKRK